MDDLVSAGNVRVPESLNRVVGHVMSVRIPIRDLVNELMQCMEPIRG